MGTPACAPRPRGQLIPGCSGCGMDRQTDRDVQLQAVRLLVEGPEGWGCICCDLGGSLRGRQGPETQLQSPGVTAPSAENGSEWGRRPRSNLPSLSGSRAEPFRELGAVDGRLGGLNSPVSCLIPEDTGGTRLEACVCLFVCGCPGSGRAEGAATRPSVQGVGW